jgi:hypothetical protein
MPLMGTIGSAAAKPYDFGGVVEDTHIANVGTLILNNGANLANNNSFLDSGTGNSGAPFTVTRTGTSIGQGRLSPFAPQGYSWFLGQNNYTTNITATVLTVSPTATFTIEGWMFVQQPITTTEQMAALLANNNNNFNSTIHWGFGINGRRQATFQWFDVNGIQTYSHPQLISINTWVYIQVTANNGVLQMAVNGQVTNNPFFTRTTLTSPAATVGTTFIGCARQYTPGAFIAGLRVSNIVRPFVVPNSYYSSDANTTLLTCQSNRFIDQSSNGYAITVQNIPSAFAFTPFQKANPWTQTNNAGSAVFDGTATTYLSIADNVNLELGSGDFCIEFWTQIPSNAAGTYTLLSKRANSAAISPYLVQRNGNNIVLSISGNGTTYNIVNGVTIASIIPINAWIHIAIYRIGNAVYTSYNGVVTSRYSGAAFTVFNNATANFIGADTDGSPWTGALGPMRWMIGAVPPGYTSTACPVPTAPFTNITNTRLLMLFSNGNVFETQNRMSINTGAGMNLSTTQRQLASASLNFTGLTYGIFALGPNPGVNLGGSGNIQGNPSDFTIEFFVWVTNFAAGRFIVDIYNGNASTRLGFKTDITTGILSLFGTGSSAIRSTPVGIPSSTWLHVAASRKDNILRFFVNGAQQGTNLANSTQAYVFDSTNAYFGTDGGSVGTSTMLGYISNFRITRGVGRYTQNFKIPNTAFPTFAPRT